MASIHFDVPEDLKARVDERAQREQRTIKAVVIRALERYLAETQERGNEAA